MCLHLARPGVYGQCDLEEVDVRDARTTRSGGLRVMKSTFGRTEGNCGLGFPA